MQVLHIQNANALRNPMLVQLFKEALEETPDAAPGGWETCAEDVYAFVTDPGFVTCVGVEDGNFVCLMVALLPNNNVFPYPSVLLMYAKGSVETSRAVKERMVDIMLEKGYTFYRTANMSGHSDAAWERVMRWPGVTFKPTGTIYNITVD